VGIYVRRSQHISWGKSQRVIPLPSNRYSYTASHYITAAFVLAWSSSNWNGWNKSTINFYNYHFSKIKMNGHKWTLGSREFWIGKTHVGKCSKRAVDAWYGELALLNFRFVKLAVNNYSRLGKLILVKSFSSVLLYHYAMLKLWMGPILFPYWV
jgi:hypothetical protein